MPNLPKNDLSRKTQIGDRIIDGDLSPSRMFAQTKLSTQGKLDPKMMGEPAPRPAPVAQPEIVGRSTKFKD